MLTSDLLVTPAQRDRAVEILQEMYADDRLNRLEFDTRLEQALTATTRAQLNSSFDGLLDRPVPTYAPVAFTRPAPCNGPPVAAGGWAPSPTGWAIRPSSSVRL
jgi:hypothetical protein